jgi:quercetin dioxygenase-like cupin family protein
VRALPNLPQSEIRNSQQERFVTMPSRRDLIHQTLLAAPFLSRAFTHPVLAGAQPSSNEQWYWYPGHAITIKGTGKETGGITTWMLIENSAREGVPFHKHLHEDESFYVIDGLFEITIGDATIRGGPGTFAFGPRNLPHRWTNVGDGRGRLLNVFNPSGIEDYFLAVAIPVKASTDKPQVDIAEWQSRTTPLREKFGIIRTGLLKYPVSTAASR